jgi:hypothetical protein
MPATRCASTAKEVERSDSRAEGSRGKVQLEAEGSGDYRSAVR